MTYILYFLVGGFFGALAGGAATLWALSEQGYVDLDEIHDDLDLRNA